MEQKVIGCVLILLGIAAGMYAAITGGALRFGDTVLAALLAALLIGAGIAALFLKRK